MTKQEIIKQVEAIIDSEIEDIFFIRGEMMVKCVMSIESLKTILEALKEQVPKGNTFDEIFRSPDSFSLHTPKKYEETEEQRRERLMKHYRD